MNENEKDSKIESLEEKVSHLSRMLVKSFGYAEQDPDTFLQNARKTTEAICRFIYLKDIGEPKKKMMLSDYGRELVQKKIVPDRIGILIGTIQTYGNYAAHAQEDLSETTQEWIAPCQSALASLSNWFFLEYLQGQIPNELQSPIQDYAEKSPSIKLEQKSKQSNKAVIYSIGLAIVTITVLFAFKEQLFNKEATTNNTEITDPISTENTEIENQEQMIESLNSITPNPDAKRIAVLYFDNSSDDKSLDKLKKGLAAMIISDLSKVKMLNVIERDRIQEIIEEQNMNNTESFDAATATKLGKLLGVEHILTGAYFELMGSLRIDARLIEVETGKIVKSEGIDGPASDFFTLEKKLVWKLLSGLNIDLAVEEKQEVENNFNKEKISYEISLKYSEGLDLMDAGKTTEAIQKFEEVIKAQPNFEPAKRALQKLKQPA
jgi:TolB-like protein